MGALFLIAFLNAVNQFRPLLGERGLLWYDDMRAVRTLPALAVPSDRVLDTNGAGDVFHGAYVYSHLAHPEKDWQLLV